MPILHALIRGIVQGLTEFLPISSSGHLILVPWLFRWDELGGDLQRTFDVALHAGTFIGAAWYFRGDLADLIARDRRRGWLLALASVPAALAGAALDSITDDPPGGELVIGVMLIVFGLVLWWADRLPERRPEDSFGARDAVLMGVAQAAALQPGVSRSGVTISAGRALGFDRPAATRLSFLMSLPIIAGAAGYKGLQTAADGGIPSELVPPLAVGMVASAVTGFLAVWLLLRMVRGMSFAPFVGYRLVAGAVVILIALAR